MKYGCLLSHCTIYFTIRCPDCMTSYPHSAFILIIFIFHLKAINSTLLYLVAFHAAKHIVNEILRRISGRNQLHSEIQRRVRRNHTAGAAPAVAKGWRDHHVTLSTHGHVGQQSLVPARNHLTSPNLYTIGINIKT